LKEITYILANLVKNCKAKGSVLENEFKRYFEKWNYMVLRSAGSFGIDLIALKKDCKPVLINVKWKRVYCGPDERKELIDDANRVNGIPVIGYKFIEKNKKNGKHMIEIITNFDKKGYTLLLPHLKNNSSSIDLWIKLCGF
jgi:Holliday junction resolvase